jgi:phage terminase large subunit
MTEVIVDIPKRFKPLLNSQYRNKLYYGGRAGGKSFAFADCLLLLGRSDKLFVACVREVQNSIKDSVYKLLKDRAEHYEFDDYRFYEDRIENVITGTRFVFKGLKDQNKQNIKSLEGVDICWIEEGQSISKDSWDVLNPTIRKKGSQIWVSMNREEENDPIWVAVASNPDEKTYVCKVNYYDNPYCPDEMKYLAERCKEQEYDDYLHIWEGEPIQQGNTKLIGAKAVKAAFEPKMDSSTSPLVIGLDIARFGDDATVFCFRKGRWCFKFEEYAKKDTVEIANIATNLIRERKPARLFLDDGGVGGGVYDILKDRGFGEIVRGVNFGARSIDDERYANRRAEMWDAVREWLTGKVQLPKDDKLLDDLCSVNKKYDQKGRLQLESKDDVKKRLGRSPDKADALALTFAEPVYDIGQPRMYGNGNVTFEDLFADSKKGDDGSW